MASDPDAQFDDVVRLEGAEIAPSVTWGINPGQNLGVNESIPSPADVALEDQAGVEEALDYMGLDLSIP